LREGDFTRRVAHHGSIPNDLREVRPLTGRYVTNRAILEGRPIHVQDILNTEREDIADARAAAPRTGYRTLLAMPLLREGDAIGALTIRRREVQPFTEKQIALLQTFADQAVIAIENVRLFTETKETLEQQTATSEILRVISTSPSDVQPVFETILARAVQLCGARHGSLFRFDGELLHSVAQHNVPRAVLEIFVRVFPVAPSWGQASGRAVLTRQVVMIEDVLADETYEGTTPQVGGFRSMLSVPLLRDRNPIGVIVIVRTEAGPFPDKAIALLQTFADQAVIAIENVRLFTELQTSNRELTTALDQQTATSEVLRTIAQTKTDPQPVFDTIVQSAVRLLGARSGSLTRVAGDQIALAALTSTDDAGDAALRAFYPRPLESPQGLHGQVLRDRAPFNVGDAPTDPRLPEAVRTIARTRGYRSQVAVPLLRHDEAIGALAVNRHEPGGFAPDRPTPDLRRPGSDSD
jgi:two-component system, NtrC family, sensor kinase